MIDDPLIYARYGVARTLCEFVTGLAYAMEASGGLDEGLSDRMDAVVAPVRSDRDWLWHVGELMSRTKPLPADVGRGLESAERRALDALPQLKRLIGEACDSLGDAKVVPPARRTDASDASRTGGGSGRARRAP